MKLSKVQPTFEVCVRALIRQGNKILLCKRKGRNYYFFPGGHVEFGENAKDALIRELKEELNLSVKNLSFIGVLENIFRQEGKKKHEFNLVFSVKAQRVEAKSAEDHLEFFFFDIKRFAKARVLPIALKKRVLKRFKNW